MARGVDTLRYVAVALVLAVGAVHYQQYIEILNEVETVGVLFLLNAAGAAAIAVALLWNERTLRTLGAIGGVALSVGSLVSILIARGGGLFGYQEPNWRTAVVIAVVVEVAALPTLVGYLALGRRGTPV